MTLDPQRWTLKTREAFQAATTQAQAAGNPFVTPAHILLALLNQSDGVARPLLAAADIVVIPSRYEPCGLVQLYAQRYGAIPVRFLDDTTLQVAMIDPANVLVADDLRIMTGYTIVPAIASE